jgi:hypothetical protein
MKVLGKVWKDRVGLILEFYIRRKSGKGWWKVNPILLNHCNKRFNLRRIFTLYASDLEYPFDIFEERNQKLMWEREFEVEEELVKRKFKAAVES